MWELHTLGGGGGGLCIVDAPHDCTVRPGSPVYIQLCSMKPDPKCKADALHQFRLHHCICTCVCTAASIPHPERQGPCKLRAPYMPFGSDFIKHNCSASLVLYCIVFYYCTCRRMPRMGSWVPGTPPPPLSLKMQDFASCFEKFPGQAPGTPPGTPQGAPAHAPDLGIPNRP